MVQVVLGQVRNQRVRWITDYVVQGSDLHKEWLRLVKLGAILEPSGCCEPFYRLSRFGRRMLAVLEASNG